MPTLFHRALKVQEMSVQLGCHWERIFPDVALEREWEWESKKKVQNNNFHAELNSWNILRTTPVS